MTLSFQDHLDAARHSVEKSRAASERAKEFIDAGYIKRQERDLAVEELRNSVEHIIQMLGFLEERVADLEQRVPSWI